MWQLPVGLWARYMIVPREYAYIRSAFTSQSCIYAELRIVSACSLELVVLVVLLSFFPSICGNENDHSLSFEVTSYLICV